jgi:hypothetical protein
MRSKIEKIEVIPPEEKEIENLSQMVEEEEIK